MAESIIKQMFDQSENGLVHSLNAFNFVSSYGLTIEKDYWQNLVHQEIQKGTISDDGFLSFDEFGYLLGFLKLPEYQGNEDLPNQENSLEIVDPDLYKFVNQEFQVLDHSKSNSVSIRAINNLLLPKLSFDRETLNTIKTHLSSIVAQESVDFVSLEELCLCIYTALYGESDTANANVPIITQESLDYYLLAYYKHARDSKSVKLSVVTNIFNDIGISVTEEEIQQALADEDIHKEELDAVEFLNLLSAILPANFAEHVVVKSFEDLVPSQSRFDLEREAQTQPAQETGISNFVDGAKSPSKTHANPNGTPPRSREDAITKDSFYQPLSHYEQSYQERETHTPSRSESKASTSTPSDRKHTPNFSETKTSHTISNFTVSIPSTDVPPPTEAELLACREIFDRFDADKNGKMDVKELGKLLTTMGGNYTERELKFLHTKLDKDGSGFLEFNEFWDWWIS